MLRRSNFYFISILFLVLFSVATNSFAQTKGKKKVVKAEKEITTNASDSKPVVGYKVDDNSVLLQVGNEQITAKQLAEAYKRNSTRKDKRLFEQPKDSIIEFINLYANFRLKVLAALEAGYDKKPEIVKEMQDNRKQLATPPPPATGFLLERKLVDPAIEKIWKRRQNEVQFSAIYVSMRANDPNDTLRAYKKSLGFIEGIKTGKYEFSQLATDSTDDPNAKSSKGLLPYVTGGMILKSMEDVIFELKAGEMFPTPIRVPAGYVIIKVMNVSPRVKIRGGHILIKDPTHKEVEADVSIIKDSSGMQRARKIADSAYKRLKNGEGFANVAKQMSDDKVTASFGGDFMQDYTRSLGFEGKPGKLSSDIETALFKLKDGDFSEPIQTQIGYVIVKRFSSKSPVLADEEEKLRQVYRQYYLNEDKDVYVKKLVEKHGLVINEGTLHELVQPLDQNKTTNEKEWDKRVSESVRKKVLYSFKGKDYSVQTFLDSVKSNKFYTAMPLTPEAMRRGIYGLWEQTALETEAENLEKEYPEFKNLLNEFRDGTLIFKIEADEVWDKVKYDSLEAKKYFESNRKKYNTQTKVGVSEIYMFNEKDAKEVYQKIKEGKIPFDSLAAQNTQRLGFRERNGKYDPNTAKNSDVVKFVLEAKKNPKVGDTYEPMKYQEGYSIFKINSYEPEREMNFQEARAELSGDYMDYQSMKMGREWLMGLGKKYGVKVFTNKIQ